MPQRVLIRPALSGFFPDYTKTTVKRFLTVFSVALFVCLTFAGPGIGCPFKKDQLKYERVRTPFSVHDFNRVLLALPLNIKNAIQHGRSPILSESADGIRRYPVICRGVSIRHNAGMNSRRFS